MKRCLFFGIILVLINSCNGPSGDGTGDSASLSGVSDKKVAGINSNDSGSSQIISDEKQVNLMVVDEVKTIATSVNDNPQYALSSDDLEALKAEDDLLSDEELKDLESLALKGDE